MNETREVQKQDIDHVIELLMAIGREVKTIVSLLKDISEQLGEPREP